MSFHDKIGAQQRNPTATREAHLKKIQTQSITLQRNPIRLNHDQN
jgi:hypothetical protein